MSSRTAVVIVGVGGQGSVFIARALGEGALLADLGVVASELHGMAQRGGVVESTVVLGDGQGPIVPRGEADLLIALEPLEALRALPSLRKGGTAIVGTAPLIPFTVSQGGPPYPQVDQMIDQVRSWARTTVTLDVTALAAGAGDARAASAVALGAAAGSGALPSPLTPEILRAATLTLAPPTKRDLNGRAFDAGHDKAAHDGPPAMPETTSNTASPPSARSASMSAK